MAQRHYLLTICALCALGLQVGPRTAGADDCRDTLASAQRKLEAGDLDGAEALFRRVIRECPEDREKAGWAHLGLGDCQAEQDDCDQAKRHYDEVIIGYRSGACSALQAAWAGLKMAECWLRENSLHAWNKSIPVLEKVLEEYETLGDAEPLRHARIRLAQCYVDAGLEEEGLPLLKEALRDESLTRDEEAGLKVYLLRAHLGAGDEGSAISAAKELLSAFESAEYQASASYWLAECYLAQSDEPQAVEQLERHLEVFGEHAGPGVKARWRLAELLRKQGDDAAADQEWLQLFSQYTPHEPEQVCYRAEDAAEFYREQGRIEDEISVWRAMIADDDSLEWWEKHAARQIGKIHQRQGNPEAAVQWFETFAGLDQPEGPNASGATATFAQLEIAKIRGSSGDYEQALESMLPIVESCADSSLKMEAARQVIATIFDWGAEDFGGLADAFVASVSSEFSQQEALSLQVTVAQGYMKCRDWRRSLEKYRDLRRLYPEEALYSHGIQFSEGVCYGCLRDLRAAIERYQYVVDHYDPNVGYVPWSRRHMARAYVHLGELDKAEQQLLANTVCLDQFAAWWSWYDLARLYAYNKKEYERAREVAKKIIDECPYRNHWIGQCEKIIAKCADNP